MNVLTSSDRKHRRSHRNPLLPEKNGYVSIGDRSDSTFGSASYSGAVFNLSTTIVGAGIMALPATLKQLGLIPGLLMIVGAAALTNCSIEMILRFSRSTKSSTYPAVVGDTFGATGRTLLQACIVVNNFGMLVVYMVIIGTKKSNHFCFTFIGVNAFAVLINDVVNRLSELISFLDEWIITGDVLSGTWSNGVHHTGLTEEWLGGHGWTSRGFLLLSTTLLVFVPLVSFKRVGEFEDFILYSVFFLFWIKMLVLSLTCKHPHFLWIRS